MAQRKLVHGFLAALLVMMQLLTLLQIRSVHAVEQLSVTQKLVDTQDLSLDVVGVQNGDAIDWTVNYERPITTADHALKLDVKAGESTISPRDPTNWQQLQAVDPQWWQESEFSTQAKGSLHYQTPIDQPSLTITAQLDEQTTTQVEAVTTVAETDGEAAPQADPVETTPETTVTTDLLEPETAGPHTVTLEIPEVEVDEPVPDPDDEAAQAEATPESVVDPVLDVPAPVDETAKVAIKAVEEPMVDLDEANAFSAQNLVLTLGARADLKMNVRNLAGEMSDNGERFTKTGDGRWKYNTEDSMKYNTSTDYVDGSTSSAVIFPGKDAAADSKIELTYSDVGYVQAGNENHKIGAYVTIEKMTFRAREWDEKKMGIDFSNNFYSGVSIANMRHFDWNVTFFRADTKQVINFDEGSAARLTFTSLNPGEFVKSNNGLAQFSADPDSVKLTTLSPDNLAPDNYNDWATFISGGWPTDGDVGIEKAYTSHKWGNWGNDVNPEDIKTNIEWQDRLGTPTFGNGAAGFALVGTTFKFTRGTYSQGQETWLANASGDAEFKVPNLENNKSISANANPGGGSEQDIANTATPPYTANDLDGQNVNEQASNGTAMYYYINQQTYKVIEDVVSRPQQIVITDLLPEGIRTFTDDDDEDVIVYNERPSDTRDKVLNADVKRTDIGERQEIKVTISANEIMKMAFEGGYFSIRIRVKTTVTPDDIKDELEMVNNANVKMYGSLGNLAYDKTTKDVTVKITPTKQPDVPVSIIKTNEYLQGLPGVKFGLFQNEAGSDDPISEGTSDSNGTVNFTPVPAGVYWLKEMQTPTGYVPMSGTVRIVVNQDGTIDWPENWEHVGKVVNKFKQWQLELEKTDTDKKALSGAEFSLADASGKVVGTGVTDANAALTFGNLKLSPGNYTLTETKAPTGFETLNGKFTFTLNVNATVSNVKYSATDLTTDQYHFDGKDHKLAISIENNAEEIPLPVTGGNGIQALIAASIVIMLMALMLGWHWRKEVAR